MKGKLEQARNAPVFRFGDLFVYVTLVLLIVGMFFVFASKRDTSALTGIEVLRENEIIFSYDLEARRVIKTSEGISIEETKEGIFVTVKHGTDENKFRIKEGSVTMVSANCSLHKDCVYMPDITDNSAIIECLPHRLVIRPYKQSFDPSIG